MDHATHPSCGLFAAIPVTLTIFTIPKPFRGEVAAAQRRAFTSWRALGADILVIGDEEGAAEAAAETGARHLPGVERTELGTPLVSAAFVAADEAATGPTLCYANADIVFDEGLAAAAARVAGRPSLLVGRRTEPDGTLAWEWAIDWFAFPRGTRWEMPPFAVGRPGWDNWLIWRAHDLGLPVVDATEVVRALHQAHGYEHVPAGAGGSWEGPEAERNRELMGGKERRHSILDATHVLTARGLRPAWKLPYLKRRARRHPVLGPLLARLDPYRTRS